MTQHRPGSWPVNQPADLDRVSAAMDAPDLDRVSAAVDAPDLDELYVKRVAEKALHEMVLDSIRHDLEQQPTGPSAQAKARIWCAHVLAIGDDVAAEKRKAA